MDGKEIPNMKVVKGLIAIAIGFVLIIFSYTIILRMIFFIGGLLLLYYGFNMLDIPALKDLTNSIKNQIQKFLS